MQNKTKSGFSKWLKGRRHEDTAIGDLARDMLRDADWPKRAKTYSTYRKHLEDTGACDNALKTLARAWELFEVYPYTGI